jgi:pimeloyl-ACP methyl ester carboxylesterase
MPHIAIAGRAIEYRMLPGDAALPTLVFLHEGLGSAGLWRDFPDRLGKSLRHPILVYSRYGYGQSDGLIAPRTPRFMHEEALDILPALLDTLAIAKPWLIGHSDGASIALIHAASAGRPTAGLVLMAPHVFVEDISLRSIARIAEQYETTELRSRLARHHKHVDDAFHGWAKTWLSPEFRGWSLGSEAAMLSVPALLIQGTDDEYGTLAQIDAIEQVAQGPVTRVVLERCGHAPHRDQPERVIEAICGFVAEFLKY